MPKMSLLNKYFPLNIFCVELVIIWQNYFQKENGIPEKSQEETPKAGGDKQDNKVCIVHSSTFYEAFT